MSTTTFEDDYEDFDDEIEDDLDEDRTLSGFTVLIMGLVVLGAIFTVAWMSYHLGVRNNDAANRFVTADPEPVKIENSALADGNDNIDREVYDRFDGETSEPVEVIAAGPEAPIDRSGGGVDPITAIVEENTRSASSATASGEDAVADRIAALAAADETLRQDAPDAPRVKPADTSVAATDTGSVPRQTATRPTPASSGSTSGATTSGPAVPTRSVGRQSGITQNALSGTHLVQVGAFRSEDEANGVWSRLQSRMGSFTAEKTTDIERADLGDRGVYYRLRIGPFASRSAATTYCEGLKERSQDCLVKAK